MNVQEALKQVGEGYQQSVKPWIEKENYGMAYFEFSNLCFLLEQYLTEVYDQINCGLSLISSAQNLKQKLQGGDKESIEFSVRLFETFYAQTKLPLDTSTA